MTGSAERGRSGGSEKRPVVYCVIPPDLAPKLHELLREHFRDDPSVEVVVERRRDKRRQRADRRRSEAPPPDGEERRRAGAGTDRRVGERRAALVSVAEPPPLPRRARRYASRLRFVERLEPPDLHAEDVDTARLVYRAQAGDHEAFAALYIRYFDRVYGYLRVVLSDRHEAEDATQQVFLKIMEALPRYERRRGSFRAWLFAAVRNHALSLLRSKGRVEVLEPEALSRRADLAARAEEEQRALDWISDKDLFLFIERLPIVQRQVLLMRYLLDLPHPEIAAILGRSPDDVRAIQTRAIAFLRERLEAVGRAPRRPTRRPGMVGRTRRAYVLRKRRFSLQD